MVTRVMRRVAGSDGVVRMAEYILKGTVLLFAVGLLLGPFLFLKQAESDGARVRVGEARHPKLGSLPLATWGADPVRVAWARDSLPDGWQDRSAHCLMYLGTSAGTEVLFDVTTQEVLRLPSRAVALAVAQSAPRCTGPVP
jgi:hypothetical protein